MNASEAALFFSMCDAQSLLLSTICRSAMCGSIFCNPAMAFIAKEEKRPTYIYPKYGQLCLRYKLDVLLPVTDIDVWLAWDIRHGIFLLPCTTKLFRQRFLVKELQQSILGGELNFRCRSRINEG